MADFPAKKNAAYTLVFPMFDNAGAYLTGLTPTITISKDAGSFNAASNAAAEIGATGIYSLAVTSTEMNADRVVFKITAASARSLFATIATATRQLTDLAFPNTSGRGLDVSAGGDADAVVQSVATGGKTDVAAAVWDDLASHAVQGSMGEALGALQQGVASAGAAGTITLNASATATDDYYKGCIVAIKGGAGAGQARLITGYVGATKVASVSPNWATNPGATSNYIVIPAGRSDVWGVLGSVINALTSGRVDASVGAVASGAIAAAAFATDLDVYTAKLTLIDDNANTNDRYEVRWFKNGTLVTSGVTSPTIQVIKASDGSDLVGSTAMTQVAATAAYRYNEGTNRVADGAVYEVKTAATIDSATRTFSFIVGRDSA